MDSLYFRKGRNRSGLRDFLKKRLKSRKVLFGLLAGAPLLGYVLFGNHGVVQRFRLEKQKAELEQKIRAAEIETARLQAESKALESDMKAIEKVAREKYGMVRQGETVYKVKKSE